MSMEIVWVATGGGLGAISRFAVTSFISRVVSSPMPYGTLVVNLLGSFLLGLLYGIEASLPQLLFAGVGFLGSFTTFSTFQFDIIGLRGTQQNGVAFRYITLSLLGGIILVALGFELGRLFN
ncbi:protein CrcB [Aneurinibacillus soli]|uniref:Fluoride-specific ion channel FluC n=1 Tax=Aneurinibacillus soli TaxID=1500254 RepID=A0A0U5AXX2_9BACL|nr:CrcB family protein [Aneurinibacillus soli]PYE62199.1 protein CrcB [Aneurinibacillus soli]BAU28613.1 putative fluoride ion transporter CrcB [Aneurinibacillus soli]